VQAPTPLHDSSNNHTNRAHRPTERSNIAFIGRTHNNQPLKRDRSGASASGGRWGLYLFFMLWDLRFDKEVMNIDIIAETFRYYDLPTVGIFAASMLYYYYHQTRDSCFLKSPSGANNFGKARTKFGTLKYFITHIWRELIFITIHSQKLATGPSPPQQSKTTKHNITVSNTNIKILPPNPPPDPIQSHHTLAFRQM
jgi:hypothetical protein